MPKLACLFGFNFRAARLEKNFSQWQVVHRAHTYLANVQRVEKGQTHPGISSAFKLLRAIEASPGEFLENISKSQPNFFPTSLSPLATITISYQNPRIYHPSKSLFGPLLYQARTASLVSQTAMAKAAEYTLRNINSVEHGSQEPGIITALSLVLTTGVDAKEFFNLLYKWWLEDSQN